MPINSGSAEKAGSVEFEPLSTCPDSLRERYASRAKRADTSLKSAIELKCLECCAWDRPEVKRCQIGTCPLYALNRRWFS